MYQKTNNAPRPDHPQFQAVNRTYETVSDRQANANMGLHPLAPGRTRSHSIHMFDPVDLTVTRHHTHDNFGAVTGRQIPW